MTEASDPGVDDVDDPTLDRSARWRQVTQRLYEPDRDGELATAVVFAVADADGVSPSEVKSPPLYEAVDVVGIENAFFGPNRGEEEQRGTGTVEFRYAGYLVKVRSDGWVQIYEPSEAE